VYVADFVEDADSPDCSLFVVFPSSSNKVHVRYLQVAHDHFFLHPSYPAVHWSPIQVKFALSPIGSCQADFRYRELLCTSYCHTSFLLKLVHFFTCTSRDCILIPHYLTSIGLCIFRYLTQSLLKNADTMPKSRGTQIVQKSGCHLKI